MRSSRKQLTVASLSAFALLVAIYASRDEIYFALSHDQMVEKLNDKHLSKMLDAPTSENNQESAISQIKLLKSGRWNRFISSEKSKLLDDKIVRLNESIDRRNLLSEIKTEEETAKSKAAALRRRLLADKGKLNATVTRFLLDAPPKVTEGEATFNNKEGYLDFFNKNDSGHRYNYRCYRSGSVSTNDSIITKGLWENEPDYSCSMDIGPRGVPVAVMVKSLMNNGFVALRGTLSPKSNQTQQAAKPEHCSMTMKQKQLILDQLVARTIAAADARSKFAAVRAKASKCY